MEYLRIKNWDKFQHYRNRTPPWIKLHRDLLNDYDFSCLQDASKLQIMLIWLLASQLDNKIPNDPAWVRLRIHVDDKVDLNALIKCGFLEYASNTLADCNQSAIVETETEAYKEETEREEAPPKKTAARRKRLPDAWKLTEKLRTYCQTKRPDLDPDDTAEGFINFWLGDGRTKADWDRAFMTWVRNEKPRRNNGTRKPETAVQARQRRNREAIERANRGEGVTAPHGHGRHVASNG
jgi:hypothetical protein